MQILISDWKHRVRSYRVWPFYRRLTRIRIPFKRLLNLALFLCVFIYLNYRFNMPVFHVFRNQNILSPCQLPSYDLYDSSIQQFFWKQQPVPCEHWLDLFYVDTRGYITMNNTAVTISGYSNIRCEYRYITRVSEKEMKFSDRLLYTHPSYLDGDFIHMECYDKQGERMYNNLHLNIDTKTVYKTRVIANESQTDLSVYIVGIDSLSRLIAERKLKKTMAYLKSELNAYILHGYTRIADSSYPNIMPMFTGLKSGQEDQAGVNNLPYIFKNFSKRGAVDLFAEDWYEVATFKGFADQPTQHYNQPLIQAMDIVRPSNLAVSMTLKFLQNHNIPLTKVSSMCFGNNYRFNVQLQYYKRFIEAYHRKRKFAYCWTNEIAHDFFNMVELADNDYFELLKWMKDTNKLDNAILIVMSDHGPRYSEIQNTEVGRISNLLPLMSIVIPNHIKLKYPHIDKNLKSNINTLTTTYDVFEMLKDVLNGNFEKKSPSNVSTLQRGISLFQKIPSSRSCRDADISEHYCPCYSSKSISKDDKRVIHSVIFLVEQINDILKDVMHKCAKVILSSVVQASLVYADMQRDSKLERSYSLRSFLWTIEERMRIRVKFYTNPGNALFEGTVEYANENNVKTLGDINRINKYGNQSACIKNIDRLEDRRKRSYCYCN